MTDEIIARLNSKIKTKGFTDYSIVPLKKPISLDIYKQWLNNHLHADMEYLKQHLPHKEAPTSYFKNAQTAIVVLLNYFPEHPHPEPKVENLKVANYAKGEDYHYWFKDRLNALCKELSLEFSDDDFYCYTDSAPIMERDLAYQAGLGWFGKNSMLINSTHGSQFFLGEIYTSLKIAAANVLHPDRCGTCTRCIDACPTDAILNDRTIDSKKCISYLTIESKELPDENLRSSIGDWFYGCDICQNVCPWNEKVFGKEPLAPNVADQKALIEDLRFILTQSNKQLMRHFAKTPLTRARGFGLKRNALIVAANLKLNELKPEIIFLKENERLSGLATWALSQLA